MFSPEVILYLAIAAVGTFATPSYELSLANRFMRIIFLIATASFGVAGFVLSTTIWLILLVRLKGLHVPYMWPFIPFNVKALRDVFFKNTNAAKKPQTCYYPSARSGSVAGLPFSI